MTIQKSIAVLGANGRLSREVARAFHAAGWQVRAVTRTGTSQPLGNLAGMEFAKADAMNRDELVKATKGVDVIFNGLNPLYPEWAEKCMPMARNVMAAAKENGAIHLFPGNVYHFGTSMPETLNPDTPANPDHRKANVRFEMENLFADTAAKENIQTILLRAGDFFGGDGQGSWFDLALISKLAKDKITYPGNRNIVHAWAYLPDLANIFVALAEKADTLNYFESFHFEGHNVSGEEMHKALEAAAGKSLKRAGLPSFIFKIGGLFSPMMKEVSAMFYLWETPHQLKDDRIALTLDTAPRTPLKVAVREAVQAQGFHVATLPLENAGLKLTTS